MIKAYAAKEAGGKLEPFEYDPGELGLYDVELDVEFCGICHSDLSMLKDEWGMSQFPLVPGHEVIGTISKIGKGVTNVKEGQKVGLGWHSGYCMLCPSCMSGDHNMCANQEGTIVGRHGGFADKVRAQSVAVFPLPDGVDAKAAGPLFCGGITVFNPIMQYVKPTDKVGVIGIGGLGHLALKFLNAYGCEVTAFTSTDAKRDEAVKMGAHNVINSKDPDQVEKAAGQFDFILSTVNVSLDWNTYIGSLKPRGRLHLVGGVLEPLDISTFGLLMGNKSVSGSPVGSPAEITRMLEFCARHEIQPQIETFKFDQVNEAMEHLESGKARYRIVLTR